MARTRLFAMWTIISFTLLAPQAAQAKKLSNKQVGELEDGKLIMIHLDEDSGKGYIGGTSYGLIDEDMDKAWNAIRDANVYPKIYPTTMKSETVYKKGNKSIVRMVQGNKVVKATYYLNYKVDEENYKLSWKLNKSKPHDINDSRGYFQFSEYKDGRILMKMTSVLDIGNDIIEKLFGEKIAVGMLKMPKKFRKFLAKPVANKYAIKA